MRWWIALPLALLLFAPFSSPASAADVNVNLIAANFQFHVGSPTAPASPTIAVTAGDVIRFVVENQDAFNHTFTVPHFDVYENVTTVVTVIFVNITTTSSDVGTWQLWCDPHSSGPTPETQSGMVGFIQVNSATPPPRQPGFEAVIAVVAVLAAAAVFAVLAVRRGKKNA